MTRSVYHDKATVIIVDNDGKADTFFELSPRMATEAAQRLSALAAKARAIFTRINCYDGRTIVVSGSSRSVRIFAEDLRAHARECDAKMRGLR